MVKDLCTNIVRICIIKWGYIVREVLIQFPSRRLCRLKFKAALA